MHHILLGISLAILIALACAQGDPPSTYRAAVVEYYGRPLSPAQPGDQPISKELATAQQLKNLAEYEVFMKEAEQAGAQIILFPENGLYPANEVPSTRDTAYPYLEDVPDPYDPSNMNLNACEAADKYEECPVLVAASCLAKRHGMTLVFDMGTKVPCEAGVMGCPEDGRWQFNTQLAIGSDGTLIGRYHKRHLYYEPQYDPSPYPQLSTFTTDFGVEFGMMICFDLLFHEPSYGLVVAKGVKHLAYSTSWVNYPPLPVANAIQQGYSSVYNMNVLASQNAHRAYASSGFGIFSNGRALQTHYNNTVVPGSRMLISDVPKMVFKGENDAAERAPLDRASADEVDAVHTVNPVNSLAAIDPRDPGLPIKIHRFQAEPGTSDSISISLKNDMECNITYTVSESHPMAETNYFAYAIDARELPGVLPAPVMGCGIGICVGEACDFGAVDSVQSFASTFSAFSISGLFDDKEVVYPAITTTFGGVLEPSDISVGSVPSPSSVANGKITTRLQLQRGKHADIVGAALLQVEA